MINPSINSPDNTGCLFRNASIVIIGTSYPHRWNGISLQSSDFLIAICARVQPSKLKFHKGALTRGPSRSIVFYIDKFAFCHSRARRICRKSFDRERASLLQSAEFTASIRISICCSGITRTEVRYIKFYQTW